MIFIFHASPSLVILLAGGKKRQPQRYQGSRIQLLPFAGKTSHMRGSVKHTGI